MKHRSYVCHRGGLRCGHLNLKADRVVELCNAVCRSLYFCFLKTIIMNKKLKHEHPYLSTLLFNILCIRSMYNYNNNSSLY